MESSTQSSHATADSSNSVAHSTGLFTLTESEADVEMLLFPREFKLEDQRNGTGAGEVTPTRDASAPQLPITQTLAASPHTVQVAFPKANSSCQTAEDALNMSALSGINADESTLTGYAVDRVAPHPQCGGKSVEQVLALLPASQDTDEHEDTALYSILSPAGCSTPSPQMRPHPRVGGKSIEKVLALLPASQNTDCDEDEGDEDADTRFNDINLHMSSRQTRPQFGGKSIPFVLTSPPAPEDTVAVEEDIDEDAAAHPKRLPTNYLPSPSRQTVHHPQFGGKSIQQVLALPPASQDTVTDVDNDEDVDMTLPSNYPPIIYPVIDFPHAAPRQHLGGKTVAHMPVMRFVMENGNEDLEMEDDSDEDDKASSDVSAGEDLKADLKDALGGDFDFKGKYAFAGPLLSAPNPGLYINGLGLIGLPLSDRDAKLIAGCATQAPFGHGERTVVDTNVRDTFEIEPSRVTFSNDSWSSFVTQTVVKSVCAELGVDQSKTPRCELYKLLLYQTGSHFLPHQDTEKTDGMFATIIIVLPSLYTGGHVHVSHGPSKKVFKLASSSAFTTSFLTWYTDVIHEVKPITSGYRLALSYNLIHTSPGIPRPTLPNMHAAVSHLKHILHKWSKGAYEGSRGHTYIIAYLLEHEYSHVNLKMRALKGKDAHLVANLRRVAEEEEFVVGLANLEYKVSGVADDDGHGYHKRSRYYDGSEEEEETPGMLEEIESSLEVHNLVDLDGHSTIFGHTLGISKENLIPENPFKYVEPDDTEYEGYMGNGAGTLDYWYRRTVLVLFPYDKEADILLESGGISYALQKLKLGGSREPTDEDRKMAKFVVNRINSRDTTPTRAMAGLAVQWNDLGMWCQVMKAGGADKNLDVLGQDRIIAAWNKFSFVAVRQTLEGILEHSIVLKQRLDIIIWLSQRCSDQDQEFVRPWLSAQICRAIASMNDPKKDDVAVLMSIILPRGLPFFSDSVLPQLIKSSSAHEFWLEFIPTLQKHKKQLVRPIMQATPADGRAIDFDSIVQRCLSAAIKQWDSPAGQPRGHGYYGGIQPLSSNYKISRITQLAELCLSTKQLEHCEHLLTSVLNSAGSFSTKLTGLYTPLISELRQMLVQKSIDISAYPFSGFLRCIIGTYLEKILGAKAQNARVPNMRKIGCGCRACESVNVFLCSTLNQQTFRLIKKERDHIEQYLRPASDLVTYATVRTGSPQGLAVTKNPEIMAAAKWLAKRKDAQAFLNKVGDEATIARIMGEKSDDVVKALEGSQKFVAAAKPTTSVAPQPTTLPPSAVVDRLGPAIPALPLPYIAAPSTPIPQPMVAGRKRKKIHEVHGDVIDLTGDSP